MLSTRKIVAIGTVLAVVVSGVALAQTTPGDHSMAPDHQQMMQSGQHPMEPEHMQEMMRQHRGMMPMGNRAGMHSASTTPTLPGQDAFGAIQELVSILDADPKTDWSKVDLEALRQHLIDMNEVTLRADAAPKQIDGGLEIAVTGSGRTLVAIQRWSPPGRRRSTDSVAGPLRRHHCRMASYSRLPRPIRRKLSTFAV